MLKLSRSQISFFVPFSISDFGEKNGYFSFLEGNLKQGFKKNDHVLQKRK